MKETELKPCPFCGCEHIIAEINGLSKRFVIYCEDCIAMMELSFVDAQLGDGSFMSFYEVRKIMDELTENWNRRADNEREITDK